MPDKRGWIGIDFDGTLAVYIGGFEILGPPIPKMIQFVRDLLAKDWEIRIFTARVSYANEEKREIMRKLIEEWCLKHIGRKLQVTNEKDFNCVAIYDDKAHNVRKNTGQILTIRGYK